MEKVIKSKNFDPKKYSMIFCPDCNGSGKSFNDAKGVNVCKICGGFGLIKKEEGNSFHNNVLMVQFLR
jgi:DnaJ-class molecular chaperone